MRRQVNAAFPLASTAFLDPVDYFAWLDCEQKQSPVLPDQLRGRGHGDLHGRNLLVGMDERDGPASPACSTTKTSTRTTWWVGTSWKWRRSSKSAATTGCSRS